MKPWSPKSSNGRSYGRGVRALVMAAAILGWCWPGAGWLEAQNPALGNSSGNNALGNGASGSSSSGAVLDPSSVLGGGAGAGTGTDRRGNGEMGDGLSPGLPVTLPASEIIALLEQRPEVAVELKSLVADQLQQQGAQVNANDITDEQLYGQLQAKPDLRMRVTTFLLARGYVTEETLRANSGRTTGTGDRNLDSEDDANSARRDAASARDGFTQGDLLSAQELGGSSTQERLAALGAASPGGAGLGVGMDTRNTSSASSSSRRVPDGSVQRENGPVHSSTDVPKALRVPAPYNLRSMRDLYTQVPTEETTLKRFGSEAFLSRTRGLSTQISGRDSPIEVPLGPDYIVGPGDALTISLWGGLTQNMTRTVDHDGKILLPEGGSLDVAGMRLGDVKEKIGAVLKQQYRGAQISVTVSQLRSVRVYVVGDVQRPGGYDVTSLATPLSVLIVAGGPTSSGSMRTLRHLRGDKVLEEIDLYEFLLHGLRGPSVRFESGDTLLVPTTGPQVAISGAVRRPAIYELKTGTSLPAAAMLSEVVQDAGGFTAAAALGHITIERVAANQQRETTTIGLDEKTPEARLDAIAKFAVKDGDRVRVAPILSYSERVIYLEGHVARPGRQAYREGMRLNDVLHSYRDLLPEPADHGELVRLVAPDLHAEIIPFDVPEVLIGNSNLTLQPFDTIRILGRYEADAPRVTIHGEVLRPGVFPLSSGMTAAQLVQMAGGFRRGALMESADLTSYRVTGGDEVIGELKSIRIGAVTSGAEPGADVVLHAGDILTIHQVAGWNEIGQAVTLEGQVAYPGSYGFKEGDRLSSVMRRAGGLRSTAYPEGAVLVREQVRELEEKSRQELIRQIETTSAAARLSPSLSPGDSGQTLQLIQAQQEQVLNRLKSEPASGRLVVHISGDIASWENTPADIELRREDVLTIPKRPGFVLVTGQVYNATALTFSPGKTAGWYLQHAGGSNATANRKEIFVIRANGSIIGRHSGGWFDEKVLATKLDAGDVVVVPQRVIGGGLFWRNLLTTAQLASSIAITAAVSGL